MASQKGSSGREVRRSFSVLLACGHRPQFAISAPAKGDIITCFMCRNGQLVIGMRAMCWSFYCETCGQRRTYGHSGVQTRLAAQAHAERNNHTTVVHNPDEQTVARYTGEGEQGILPGL